MNDLEKELILLGVFPHFEAKSLKSKLSEMGLEVILNHSKETCGTGSCEIKMELLGKMSDKDQLINFFRAYQQKSLDGLDFNINQIQSTFDPNAAIVTCPACGHQFVPTNHECPDCGLCF
jgi:hypothetical protein